MRLWRAFVIMLMVGVASPAANADTLPATGDPDFAHYIVRPGDRLATLARYGLIGRRAEATVLRINHISNPSRLRAGQILRIPMRLLRDEGTYAMVETYSGHVYLLVGGQMMTARIGATVGEGARILTDRNGFVTLRLRDGSAVTLPSQTDIAIARLRRVVLTGAVEREFTLGNGRIHATVEPMTLPESTFRVVTPIAVSAVRGTDFRVEYEKGGNTALTQVDEGHVSVGLRRGSASALPPVLITAGLGIAVSLQGSGPPTALLPPPGLEDKGRAQMGEQLSFRLIPAIGAVAFRAQVSTDAGALNVIEEAKVAGPELVLPSVPAGTWFLRLSSIDGQGIEGTAQSYAFDRYRNEIDGKMERFRIGRQHVYLFKWMGVADGKVRYRFRLWLDGQAGTPSVDEVGLRSQTLDVRNLKPGQYHWQVSALLLVGGRVIESRTLERSFDIAKEQ